MTGRDRLLLAAHVKEILASLEAIRREAENRPPHPPGGYGTYELRALGSILHDFYTGAEDIFERVAEQVDGSLPSGEDWHRKLLHQMTLDVPGLRPALITRALESELAEYLRFRHVFRNLYGFQLGWEKMRPLLERLPLALARLRASVEEFVAELHRPHA